MKKISVIISKRAEKIIEEELGEDDNPSAEAEAYAERIYALELSEETENILIKECKNLCVCLTEVRRRL